MLDKSLRNFLFQSVWPDQTYNKNYKIKSQNLPKENLFCLSDAELLKEYKGPRSVSDWLIR